MKKSLSLSTQLRMNYPRWEKELIDALEAMSVQNDLIIVGLKSKIKDKEDDPARNQPQTEKNKELLELDLDK